MGARENECQISQLHVTHEIFIIISGMCNHNSCEI